MVGNSKKSPKFWKDEFETQQGLHWKLFKRKAKETGAPKGTILELLAEYSCQVCPYGQISHRARYPRMNLTSNTGS
jgi:hypothetical protein